MFSVMTETKFDNQVEECYLFTSDEISPTSPPTVFTSSTTDLSPKMHCILESMRYLTYQIEDTGKTHNTDDIMSFSKMRTSIVQKLLYLAPSPEACRNMTQIDYYAEIFRLAAMIYVKSVLHVFLPFCPMLKALKRQVLSLMLEGEKGAFGDLASVREPVSAIWAFMVAGLLSSDEVEESYFAEKIAISAKWQGIQSWDEMEIKLREFCWLKALKSEVSNRIWKMVEDLNRDHPWRE